MYQESTGTSCSHQSLNVMIELMSVISLMLAPVIMHFGRLV